MKSKLLLAFLSLSLVGCYAGTVDTGLPPSSKVIKQAWASCWIYGLVPPKTVETAALCPNGVARVETQLSFLNQVVSALTLGIYTPMQITVTCAEATSVGQIGVDVDIVVAENASQDEIRSAFADAARQAAETHRPVFVQMSR